jgi:hypothetical protein
LQNVLKPLYPPSSAVVGAILAPSMIILEAKWDNFKPVAQWQAPREHSTRHSGLRAALAVAVLLITSSSCLGCYGFTSLCVFSSADLAAFRKRAIKCVPHIRGAHLCQILHAAMFSNLGRLFQRALALAALSGVVYSQTAPLYDPSPFNFIGTIDRQVSLPVSLFSTLNKSLV